MDFQPSTLFNLPFAAELLRVSSAVFAGVAVLMAGLVVACVGKECGTLRRSMHRGEQRRARARTSLAPW